MAQLGTPLALVAFALLCASLAGCPPVGIPLGTFEFEELEARSTTSPMPVAPPPAQGDHVVDLTLRELGATRTSGGELAAYPETGMHPLRTDGALSVRIGRFFAIRGLGSLAYGSPPSRAPSIPFPSRASASTGLGLVLGYWGDPSFSIALEVDGSLVLLDNRETYRTAIGPCFMYTPVFGGDSISCMAQTYTGARSTFEGMQIVPTAGVTLDVAGFPVRWLRIGGGASLQDYVSRDFAGDVAHEAVGIARLFVEFHYLDAFASVEAQQWVVSNVTFAPALAISVGGVLWEPPLPLGDDLEDELDPEDDPGNTDLPPPPGSRVLPSPPPSTYRPPPPSPASEPLVVPSSPEWGRDACPRELALAHPAHGRVDRGGVARTGLLRRAAAAPFHRASVRRHRARRAVPLALRCGTRRRWIRRCFDARRRAPRRASHGRAVEGRPGRCGRRRR